MNKDLLDIERIIFEKHNTNKNVLNIGKSRQLSIKGKIYSPQVTGITNYFFF